MKVTVLYFAGLRETLGCGLETLVLPHEVKTLGALRDFLAARGDAWNALITTKNLRMAQNQTMAGAAVTLNDGDEIAFFPPVTGG
jgi:molybdopterin synthase sulfur carrier subunit